MDAQGVITVPPIFDQSNIREGLGGRRGHKAMIPPCHIIFPPGFLSEPFYIYSWYITVEW
jgi:hypothetical protein